MPAWYAKGITDVYAALKSGERGLTGIQAERRLAQDGPNALPEAASESIARIFARQFKSPLVYVLIAAAGVMWWMGEGVDALVILAVLVFNAIAGAYQEGRAQNTLEALRHFSETKATVARDGEERIVPDTDVVVGDVVILQEGEKVPADARITDAHALKVSEAALTGESEPVEKSADPILAPDLAVAEQRNMLFKGTHVVAGNARAVVVNTGADTEIGRIAAEVAKSETEIPLQANMRYLSRAIVAAVVVLCGALFALGVSWGYGTGEMFATVVTLAVSVIPEGLPIAITLVLATGVWRMSKRNALVKRLQAVEALGQARVIAVDKTGTITKNEMIVQRVYADESMFDVAGAGYDPDGQVLHNGVPVEAGARPELAALGRAAALAANARVMYAEEAGRWDVTGDPTEAALLVLSHKLGFRKEDIEREAPIIAEIPFDSAIKYHAVGVKEARGMRVVVVGAPEVVLGMSTHIWRGGKSRPLAERDRQELEGVFIGFSQNGLRVVAVAEKKAAHGDLAPGEIGDLTLIAFVGMKDGLRPEVPAALSRALDAGIRVVMITGDHKITAQAIAEEAGIFKPGNRVLTGEEVARMSERDLARELARTAVFARVSPADKLKIIQGYRARGEVIAMTGDGVNDAPSLVAADLGVSMGKIGTEVAKEASDIVLLDDDFGSIVAAVEEGRSIYKTIKKVILYLFSTSIGEVLAIGGALFVGLPIPVLPAQIIWLNFVTDGFLTIALAMDPKEDGLLRGTFERPKKYLIDGLMLRRMFLMALPMGAGSLYLFSAYLDGDMAKALTVSLTALAIFQWFNAWNVRSETESVFAANPLRNPYLIAATLLVVLLQIAAVYAPFMQSVLRTAPLAPFDWMIVALFAASIIAVEELRKLVSRRITRAITITKRPRIEVKASAPVH